MYISEILNKGGKRRMETQHGPVAFLPLPVQTAGICFYHVTPSSTICPHSAWCSQPGVPHSFLSASCGGTFPLSIWAATTQPAKPHFLFICHSIFASSDLNPSHGWTQTVPINTMTNPTTKHTHGYSTMSQNQGGEVLLEQTGNEAVTGPWRTRILL